MSTFGFEAEFVSGARALIATLHREGWSTMDSLHDWHCIQRRGPCVHCDFAGENRNGFRGQTDSSCDGEIISPVFGRDDIDDPDQFFSDAILALQEAAVEVDAEPGPSAGMHFHVKPDDDLTFLPLTWEFVRWEEVLKVLATGPFASHRAMNQAVSSYAQTWWEMYGRDATGSMEPYFVKYAQSRVGREADALLQRRLYNHINESDRHANLNFSETHGTAEFRLWNSSRTAWRMKMYGGVTRLFADPEFLSAVSQIELEGEDNGRSFIQDVPASLAKLIEVIETHDPVTAEGVVRQMEFVDRGEFARRFSDIPNGDNRTTQVRTQRAQARRNRVVQARPTYTVSASTGTFNSTGNYR